MVSYFVRYRGSSNGLDTFRNHYEHRHAAILRRFPNIKSLVLHFPTAWTDPFPVRPADSALLAQMQFDTVSDLDAALQSDARREARDDFQKFIRFEGDVTHEALTAKVIF